MKKVACMLIIIFSLFTLVGCSGKTDALQKELTELQQTVADLQGQLTEQTQTVAAQAEKIAELEAAKAAQAETIAALQNAENLSAEEIAALEAQLAEQENYLATLIPKGAFCSLTTAYNNGWLSDAEIEVIANRYNKRDTDESISKIVYNTKYIDSLTLYAIKKTYMEAERKNGAILPNTVNELYFGAFYGNFGKYIVLRMAAKRFPNSHCDAPPIKDTQFGNVIIEKYCEWNIYVWYPIEG